MTNSYSKQLEDWVKQRDMPRGDANLVRFLAVREDVSAAVASGFAVKTIWTNMREEGRIGVSYHTFLRYVKRHIHGTDRQTDALVDRAEPASKVDHRKTITQTDLATSKAPGTAPSQGFTFNPFLKLEDLI
jgi:hypothetical protein